MFIFIKNVKKFQQSQFNNQRALAILAKALLFIKNI